MECVSTTSTSVLVNGCPTKEFKFERELRQDGPLSPFLFLIVAEGLNFMINVMMEAGLLRVIRLLDQTGALLEL